MMEQRHSEPGFCVAVHAFLVVSVWGRVSVAADIEHLSRVQRQVVAEHGYCATLSIIRAGLSTTVTDDVREAGNANVREFAHVNRGSAMVVEGGGFRVVFFRSLLTSVQLLTRSSLKQKVFESIDDGVGWLLERPGVDPALAGEREHVIAAAYAVADAYGQTLSRS
jgi:hypothetical protein